MNEVNPRIGEIIGSLSTTELNAIILEVTDYSAALLKMSLFVRKREYFINAEDLTMEAIQRVLDGRRKWDPDKEPILSDYLKSVVKSIYDHDVKDRIDKENVEEPIEHNLDPVDSIQTINQNPLQNLEYIETQERIIQLCEKEEEQFVLLCIFEGFYKSAEIAKQLDLNVEEVYRIKRNIKRQLLKQNKGVSL